MHERPPLSSLPKPELRELFKRRLAALPPEAAQRASAAIVERVLAMPEVEGARGVFVCLSFGDEPETGELVRRLLAAGKRLFVPRSERRGRRLHLHPYPCKLVRRSFGLLEPAPGEPELADGEVDREVELALIVGLAFDLLGSRLGYGAGYFDRFLVGRPFPTIGLAFETQLVEDLPAEPHDVRVQAIVTEARVVRPRLGSGGRGDQGN